MQLSADAKQMIWHTGERGSDLHPGSAGWDNFGGNPARADP
jgi:hypothetical protein